MWYYFVALAAASASMPQSLSISSYFISSAPVFTSFNQIYQILDAAVSATMERIGPPCCFLFLCSAPIFLEA